MTLAYLFPSHLIIEALARYGSRPTFWHVWSWHHFDQQISLEFIKSQVSEKWNYCCLLCWVDKHEYKPFLTTWQTFFSLRYGTAEISVGLKLKCLFILSDFHWLASTGGCPWSMGARTQPIATCGNSHSASNGMSCFAVATKGLKPFWLCKAWIGLGC